MEWWVLLLLVVTAAVALLVAAWSLRPLVTRLSRITLYTKEGQTKVADAVSLGVYGVSSLDLNHRLLLPLRKRSDVQVAGLASSSEAMAKGLAERYHISQSFSSYDAMLLDPTIQAVYIAAPIPQRAELIARALLANKHVLCLPPLTANSRQSRDVTELAAQMRRSLVEAVAFRHHPLAERIMDVVQSGVLGQLRHINVTIRLPIYLAPRPGDPRLNFDEAGGAMMHLGVHAVHMLRFLLPGQPQVVNAKARLYEHDQRVDEAMVADLVYEDVDSMAGAASISKSTNTEQTGPPESALGATSSLRSASTLPGPWARATPSGVARLASSNLSRSPMVARGDRGIREVSGSPVAFGGALRRTRSSASSSDSVVTKKVTATIDCDLRAWRHLKPAATVTVVGADGELSIDNFLLPHVLNRLTVRDRYSGHGSTTERVYGPDGGSPFEYMLHAFADDVRHKIRCCRDRDDASKTINLIDRIYKTAGMSIRGGETDVAALLDKLSVLGASAGAEQSNADGDRKSGRMGAVGRANSFSASTVTGLGFAGTSLGISAKGDLRGANGMGDSPSVRSLDGPDASAEGRAASAASGGRAPLGRSRTRPELIPQRKGGLVTLPPPPDPSVITERPDQSDGVKDADREIAERPSSSSPTVVAPTATTLGVPRGTLQRATSDLSGAPSIARS